MSNSELHAVLDAERQMRKYARAQATEKLLQARVLTQDAYYEEFAIALRAAIASLARRKPVDPHYMIGGQTHPTIAASFALEELYAMLDKFEEKPYSGIFVDGNFVEWANPESELRHAQAGHEYNVYKISVRTANENGWVLPEKVYEKRWVEKEGEV